ncbi:hypothetical protein BJF86_13170 [Serinicoccus sp. CNJ-927]|uniref:hypothetical protein n=1 Tax=Serinicoccus sp. CNJ-927 TaxID=1904970 RepID=UPI00096423D9|nr:hypothetical protein [Serinicoccus sp. CNJ-927]OLT43905.1 hypothetical protein BJF86_13170 [Serinicoccus sp. CNJ-927]
MSVPDPAPDSTNLTVLDLSWDPRVLARAAGWLSTALFTAPAPVLVATATVPGVRHLEAVLHVLPEEATPVAIFRVGHRQRRWPTTVHQQTGPRTRALHDAGRLLQFPTEPQLAVTGLNTGPLSRTVVAAAAEVLDLAHPDAHHTTTPTTKEMNR